MKPASVQVGDHPAEPIPFANARRQAQLFAIQKVSFSAEQYRDLAERYADAAQAFQVATANKDFAGVRSAYLTLQEITEQTSFLNIGVFHAVNDAERETRR